MATRNTDPIFGEDVFIVTARGEMQLRGSETSLSAQALELLVLIDGQSTVAEVKGRIPSLSAAAVDEILKNLRWSNLITIADQSNALDFVDFFNSKSAPPSQAAVAKAEAEAPEGASTLQKQGYFVRIARKAGERKLEKGQKLSILAVEDEPHLVKFLKQFLTLDGFNAEVATNRAEIINALRKSPPPDLVLLDVMLPDADGFEVLAKMRQHPALKNVPVIMLTAKATREAVLKGLSGGADGYVTKPFEMEVLVKAVKSVLGLPQEMGTSGDEWGKSKG